MTDLLLVLDLLQFSYPFSVAYGVYFLLSMVIGVVLAVVLVVPKWRERRWTIPGGGVLFFLGLLGWGKILASLFYMAAQLEARSPTAANALAIALVGLLAVGIFIGIVHWLKQRLRGPHAVRRLSGDVLFVGGLIAAVLLIDFVEKHYDVPAYWIAMAVLTPGALGFAWWRESKAKAHDVAGFEG